MQLASTTLGVVKHEVISPGPKQPQDEVHSHPLASLEACLEMLSLEEFVGPIDQAGGSMQFVCNRIAKETEDVLAQRLSAFFEPNADLSYSSKESMPMDDDKERIFKLTDLGYGSLTTTKGPPRLHTCLSIIDSMFTDGLITQNDPLLIWKNPQTMHLNSFWMSYVKGHARSCTALAVAIMLMEKFPDAATLKTAGGGTLLASLQTIRVRVAMCAPDVMAVAFKNAQLSHRGSMRKAHDVLAWIKKNRENPCCHWCEPRGSSREVECRLS